MTVWFKPHNQFKIVKSNDSNNCQNKITYAYQLICRIRMQIEHSTFPIYMDYVLFGPNKAVDVKSKI